MYESERVSSKDNKALNTHNSYRIFSLYYLKFLLLKKKVKKRLYIY